MKRKISLFMSPLMAVTFLASCGGNTPTPPEPTPTVDYQMIFNGADCTANNKSSYAKNDSVSFIITANEDFVLPTSINVEGVDDYEYHLYKNNEGIATFTCIMPANDIKVTVKADKLFKMNFVGAECTANNKISYIKGDKVSFTINANDNCVLPETISVVGTTNYKYALDELYKKTATFTCTMPANDVNVMVDADELFKMTFTGMHCIADNKASYAEGTKISFTINADDNCVLPEKISVKGTADYNYELDETHKKTATFTCTMPDSNVEVIVNANKLNVLNFTGTNCSANNEISYVNGADASFTITANKGCTLPHEINVEGVTDFGYELASDNKTATFTCKMTNSVNVRVIAVSGSIPTSDYAMTFTGKNCSANNEISYTKSGNAEFELTAKTGCVLPKTIYVVGTTDYTYVLSDESNSKSATFTCKMTHDITVIVDAELEPIEPVAKDIKTDSWETFCYYANKGEEAFKEAYNIEDLKVLIDPLNKTGKQLYRDVTISIHGVTLNASVRLIGINHDTISESSEEKKALFTFEFKDCVLSNVPYGFDPVNVTYQDSFVHACCETIFEGLPQELASSIKTVNKDTYNYTETSEDPMEDGEMKTTKEKLFLLSDYEVNGEEEPYDPMKPLEGKPYDFYKVIQYGSHEDIRVKLMPDAKDEWDYCNYWLRSPYLVTGSYGDKVTGAWAVFSEGNNGAAAGYKQNAEPTSEYFYLVGIAPAFCI